MPAAIIKDIDILGKRFQSNSCNMFTVLRKTDVQAQGNKGNYLYEVEFDEINNVKYKKLVRKEDILKGKILNPYFPTMCGVGYLGLAVGIDHLYEYDKWHHMLSRCYNPKDPKYKTYGAVGIYVCDRWLCFEYFLEDFPKIEGYIPNEKQSLDKDIRSSGNKYYSLDTCMLTTPSINSKEANNRLSPYFQAISPDGDVFISNCQRDFVRNYGLNRSGINGVLRGKQNHHRGWTFEYINGGNEHD